MQRTGIVLAVVLTATMQNPCKPEIKLDCEQSMLNMDYHDGLPVFEIDLQSVTGKTYDTMLEVYEAVTDIPGVATCNVSSFGGNGWAIEGDFTTATYGQTPENATRVWPDGNDESSSMDLIDGQVYMAQASHKAWMGYQDYCNSLIYVWVQGDPDSVLWCGTVPEEE